MGLPRPAAAVWLGEHPSAPLSAKSLAAVADRYFQHTPAAAVDWAAALPAGPSRDAALESVRKSLETTTTLKPETRDSLKAALPKS